MQTRFKGKIQAMVQLGNKRQEEGNQTSSQKLAKQSVTKNEAEYKLLPQPQKKSKSQLLQQKMKLLKGKKKQQPANVNTQSNQTEMQLKEQTKQISDSKVEPHEDIGPKSQQNVNLNEMHTRQAKASDQVWNEIMSNKHQQLPQPQKQQVAADAGIKCQASNKLKQQGQPSNVMVDEKQENLISMKCDDLLVELKQKQEQRLKHMQKQEAQKRLQKMQQELKRKSLEHKLKKEQDQHEEDTGHKVINQPIQKQKVQTSQKQMIEQQNKQVEIESQKEEDFDQSKKANSQKEQYRQKRQYNGNCWWEHPIMSCKHQRSQKRQLVTKKLMLKELFRLQTTVKKQKAMHGETSEAPSKCSPKFVLGQFEMLRNMISNL